MRRRTLRCARAVAGWHALKPHVIVVDNESTEATRGVLSAAVPAENLICSTVDRQAMPAATIWASNGRWRRGLNTFCFLTPTPRSPRPGVGRLLARLDAYTQIAIVGPVVNEANERQLRRLVGGRDIARHSFTRITMWPDDTKIDPSRVPYSRGRLCFRHGVSRPCSVFKEIGLLDEEYFLSGEIAAYCKRVRDKGYKVCVDLEVEAQHHAAKCRWIGTKLFISRSAQPLSLRTQIPRGAKVEVFCLLDNEGNAWVARAVLQWKISKARAILLAVIHGNRGRYGNQNAAFV